MKKIFSLMLLSSALLSCRSSSGRSALDAASFSDGTWTYLVYYNPDPSVLRFVINKCRSTTEIDAVVSEGKDLNKAKALCNGEVSTPAPSDLKEAIASQISNISFDDILNSKMNRSNYLTNEVASIQSQIDRLNSEMSALDASSSRKHSLQDDHDLKAIDLQDLIKQQAELNTALAASKSQASMKALKDLDLIDTLRLVEKGQESANLAADIFISMLADKDKIYKLDVNKNRILVKAIQNFDAICRNDTRTFESGEIDQGVERMTYACMKGGLVSFTSITCPLPGYERVSGACVFTGKGLALANITASHSGICAVTKGKAVTCWGKAGSFPLNYIATSEVKPAGFGRLPETSPKLGGIGFGGTGTPIAQMLGNSVIGADHAMCSLDSSNKINRCWPELNSAPINTDAFTSVQSGYAHYCGLTADKTVKCWGENSFNQMSVPFLSNVTALSAAGQSTCALTSDGKVNCLGTMMGNLNQSLANSPGDMKKAIAISTGAMHACAIMDDNSVRCWGENEYGQTSVPSDLGGVRSVGAGRFQTCAITMSKDLRCWGKDNSSATFADAPKLQNVARIFIGNLGLNICAKTLDDKVFCWGTLQYGVNTDDRNAIEYSVTPPANLGKVDDIVISSVGYICARMSSGGLTCWGNVDGMGSIPAIFQN